jgi:uncharacterized Fe-S cluster protein YjdI
MYTAYGDESADETKQRVFAIAGLFGNQSDWDKFNEKWLERTDGRVFHAADCDSDKGDYEGIDHHINKTLYADLAQLIAKSNLWGLAVTVSLRDYKEILAPFLDEEPYYICFEGIVIGLARHSTLCIPRDRVEFKFDRNPEIHYNASQLYDRIIKLCPSDASQYMQDTISFVTRENVGIQAADLVAREAMKLLDNRIGPIVRHARGAARALAASGRIEFRPPYTRNWCEEAVRRSTRSAYPKAEFFKWIEERGIPNTLSNRLKYEIWRRTEQGQSSL